VKKKKNYEFLLFGTDVRIGDGGIGGSIHSGSGDGREGLGSVHRRAQGPAQGNNVWRWFPCLTEQMGKDTGMANRQRHW